jgi:hypothetical protein
MATQNVTRAGEATVEAAPATPLNASLDAQLLVILKAVASLADSIQAQAGAVLNGADDSGLLVGVQALAGQVGWAADTGVSLLGGHSFKVTPAEWMLPALAVAQD